MSNITKNLQNFSSLHHFFPHAATSPPAPATTVPGPPHDMPVSGLFTHNLPASVPPFDLPDAHSLIVSIPSDSKTSSPVACSSVLIFSLQEAAVGEPLVFSLSR